MTCCTHDCNEGRACPLRTSNGGERVTLSPLPELCKSSRRLFKIVKPSLFQRLLKLLKVKP
jgi:hypothetical protein